MVTKLTGSGWRWRSGKFLPKRFGPIKILLRCCTLVAAIFAILAGFIILSTYANRVDEVHAQLETLSSVLADHADRTFEALDVLGRGVLAEFSAGDDITPGSFATLMSGASIHQRLRDKVSGLPTVEMIAIIDSKANLVNFSRAWPVPKASASDRDYFKAVSQPNGPDIYISKPVPSHITGTWSIFVARRVNSPSGEFLGLIVASMETKQLETFFAGIARTPGDAISMVRADGVLLARYPTLNDKIGTVANDNVIFTNATSPREFHRLTSAWDGQDRFVATTRSARYPLVINVSKTVSAAFMRWNRQTWFLAGATALLELGLAAVAIIGSKELQGRLQLSQERAEKGRLIAETELALAREREMAAEERSARDRQFRVAIETMRQGLCMFDRDEKLVVFNHRVATKLGIPIERLSPGLSLQSLIALLEEYGTIDAEGAARIRQSLNFSLSEPTTQTTIETLLDGRILSYSVRAMTEDKGWVLTCEDVTDRHKAEQRLLHISLHDPLTDLANRTSLRTRVEFDARRVRPHEGSALLYIDLDGFKEINDSLGHPTGDAVLQAVAERLRKSTRGGDTVARIGGDEFVIVQSSATHPATAAALADRLIAELRRPFEVSGHNIVLGASIGISFIQPGVDEPDLFIKERRPRALRGERKTAATATVSSNQSSKPPPTAKSKVERRAEIGGRQPGIRRPLPAARKRTGTRVSICGFEALVRWQHPTRGLVAPRRIHRGCRGVSG